MATSVGSSNLTAANTWQLLEAINPDPSQSSTMAVYTNGTLVASGVTQSGSTTVTAPLFINGQGGTSTNSYPSYLAEVIAFNSGLSLSNRQLVEGYLAWKWGIQGSLPNTHPYYSATPSAGVTSVGNITVDASGNIKVSPTNNLRITAPTEWRTIMYTVSGTSLIIPTPTTLLPATNSGALYTITNTGFNALTLPTYTSASPGLFWTLANSTSSILTITVTYTSGSGLGSSITLGAKSSINIYWNGSSFSAISEQGPTGPTGASGVTGPTGASGVTGPTGASGVTGPTGASGANGTNGATGASGVTGPGFTTISGSTGTSNVLTANGSNSAIGQSNLTFNGSSLIVTGKESIIANGTSASNNYGLTGDTLTLQSSSNAFSGGIASLFFGTATAGYPLARVYGVDLATSGADSSALVFQNATASANASLSGTSVFTYTGSSQSYTVPAGTSTITITMWGAGGGGGSSYGGPGAYVSGTLPVTAGQVLTIVTGQGGPTTGSAAYGGGGASSGSGVGAGGGRSAIQKTVSATIPGNSITSTGTTVTYSTSAAHGLFSNQPVVISGLSPAGYNGSYIVSSIPSSTSFVVSNTTTGSGSGTGTILAELVTLAGGGGGATEASGGPPYGGAGGITTGGNGTGGGPGFGGTQTAGGNSGGLGSQPGKPLQGGIGGANYIGQGPGGGGGYWGGGGGIGYYGGGGGGGSSYLSNITILTSGQTSSGNSAPGTTDPNYISGIAVGGSAAAGGNGLVVITAPAAYVLAESMRIHSNGYVGIGTAGPAYSLDVSGTARATSVIHGTNASNVIGADSFSTSNLSVQAASNIRLQAPTEWRYITSNISATSITLSSNYYSTVYRLTNAGFNTISLPATQNASGSWWSLSNATSTNFTISTVTNWIGSATSPSTIPANTGITVYYDGSSNYFTQNQGPIGPTGASGANGTNGATGASGVQGITGPTGASGAQGTTGPTGASGVQGITGPTGASGVQGTTGPTGASGVAGIDGTTGPTGASGVQGTTGPTGASGANGTNGATGASGAQGTTGVTGPIGPAGDSFMVAVGAGTYTIAYSYDGIAWTGVTGSTSIFSTQGRNVAWNGSMWVAVGQGTNSIAYSSDGINWTGITGTSIFSTSGVGIAWNGSMWVAVGGGTNSIAYSYDGINWKAVTGSTSIFLSNGANIAWNGSMWVAVGNGTNAIAYSYDGMTWKGVANSLSAGVLLNGGISVAWNGIFWVATGSGSTNTMSWSYDGINWTGIGNAVFNTNASAIAFNGTAWVAVGDAPGIGYSTNGTTWSQYATTVFSSGGLGVSWNGTRWVAVGSGTNSIAWSTNSSTSWNGVTGTSIFTSGNGISARRILPYIGSSPVSKPVTIPPNNIPYRIAGTYGSNNIVTCPDPNNFTITNGTSNWASMLYSAYGYPQNVYASARLMAVSAPSCMFGLSTNPANTTNTNGTAYYNINYAMFGTNGLLYVYESGSQIGSYGSHTSNDLMTITYDGYFVRYYVNNSNIRTSSSASTGSNLYFATSLYAGAISNINYGPMIEPTQAITNNRLIVSNVTTTSVSPAAYTTYYNITNSGFNTITLPASQQWEGGSYWVFRNNTSSYLNITTITYQGTGGTPGTSTGPVIPPGNSLTIVWNGRTGSTSTANGVGYYTFF